jgi:uncharacterized protein DUF955
MTMFDPTAQTLIGNFQREAPVSVAALANALGLKVWSSDLPRGISGKLFRSTEYGGEAGFAIFVNSHEPETRQRFTIAHELGHFLLHRHKLDEGEIVDDAFYRSRLSSSLETEANKAAAEILMPWHLINSLLNAGTKDPRRIAESLNVSETAIRIRLGLPT